MGARDHEILSRSPRFQFFRERRLRQENAGVPPTQVEPDNGPEVQEMAENYTKVADKARTVLNEASRLAILRRIPVPASAVDVRAAVQRRDPDSSGAYITYELYRSAVHYSRQRYASLPPEILDTLTGDPVTDQRNLIVSLRTVHEGMTKTQAELIASQIVILFALKMMQLGMDALFDGQQVATKQPSGSEAGVIAAQIALSIAAQQLYAGLNEALIEDSLEELNSGLDQGNVAAAKEQLRQSPMFNAAMEARKPSDYEIIVRFADAFIHRQTDPGWENWQFTGLLLEAESWAKETSSIIQHYGRERATDDREVSNEIVNLLRESISVDQSGTVNSTEVRMLPEMQQVYQAGLGKLNRGVDAIAQVLGHSPTIEDLCCFIQWVGQNPPDQFKTMRTMLKFFQNGLEKLDSLQNSQTLSATLSVSSAIHQSIMLLLQDLNEKVVKRYKRWFQTDPDKWAELNKCRLIDELLEYLVRTLEKWEGQLLRYLERYLSGLEDFEQQYSAKVDVVGNQKEIRFLISLIDQFSNTTENLADPCPDTTDPRQLAQAVRRAQEALGPVVALPSAIGGDPYATVQSPPVQLSTGITVPATENASAGTTPEEVALEVCNTGTVNQNLVPFPRGPLNGEATA